MMATKWDFLTGQERADLDRLPFNGPCVDALSGGRPTMSDDPTRANLHRSEQGYRLTWPIVLVVNSYEVLPCQCDRQSERPHWAVEDIYAAIGRRVLCAADRIEVMEVE